MINTWTYAMMHGKLIMLLANKYGSWTLSTS